MANVGFCGWLIVRRFSPIGSSALDGGTNKDTKIAVKQCPPCKDATPPREGRRKEGEERASFRCFWMTAVEVSSFIFSAPALLLKVGKPILSQALLERFECWWYSRCGR